jgi:hypothetical protein
MSRYNRHYRDEDDFYDPYSDTLLNRFAGQAIVGIVIVAIAGIIYLLKEWLTGFVASATKKRECFSHD